MYVCVCVCVFTKKKKKENCLHYPSGSRKVAPGRLINFIIRTTRRRREFCEQTIFSRVLAAPYPPRKHERERERFARSDTAYGHASALLLRFVLDRVWPVKRFGFPTSSITVRRGSVLDLFGTAERSVRRAIFEGREVTRRIRYTYIHAERWTGRSRKCPKTSGKRVQYTYVYDARVFLHSALGSIKSYTAKSVFL